jgi:hypothetical protein
VFPPINRKVDATAFFIPAIKVGQLLGRLDASWEFSVQEANAAMRQWLLEDMDDQQYKDTLGLLDIAAAKSRLELVHAIDEVGAQIALLQAASSRCLSSALLCSALPGPWHAAGHSKQRA